jgi:hypothetical protein
LNSDDETQAKDSFVARSATFESAIINTIIAANYEVLPNPVVAGQRLDAIIFARQHRIKRTIGLEVRYVRENVDAPTRPKLDSPLFKLAYLTNRGLIDNGIIIVNIEPRSADRERGSEMGIAVLLPIQLAEILKSRHGILNLFEPRAPLQSTSPRSPSNSVASGSEPRKRLFVAIQFSDHNDDVFNFGISNAAARLGMEAYRVSDIEHNNIVVEQIHNEIRHADYVIGELSDDNQNVYYEVGFAHALGKPVVLVAKAETKIRFDLASTNCIFYRNITDLDSKLENRLRALL